MRKLDPAFAAHIATGATTLATCWRIIRRDGVMLGFTDHDLPFSFDGTEFLPAGGADGSEVTAKLGAQTDTSEILGVLTSDAIAEDDILLGRYDGATVETWRVNWQRPAERHLLRRDTIGEIIREDGSFRAELRSGQEAANVRKGRLYQGLCNTRLGTPQCGIDLDDAALKTNGSVVEVTGRNSMTVNGFSGFAAGWFAFGHLLWTSGQREGLSDGVLAQPRNGSTDSLTLEAELEDWVLPGDSFTIYAGCDRRFATCRQKFGNAINFRGFPHIPGSDFVLKYPKSGDALNGAPIVK